MQGDSSLKHIFYPSDCSIGLDIGNFSVKVAQIKKRGFHQEKFLSFAVVQIQGDKSHDRIIEAIKQACLDAAVNSNKVNLSICGPNIIMRYIILPLMKEVDFSKSLEFELEKYIPYKKEDVVVDYRILAKLPNNQMVTLLVAAQHWLIQERINLVQDAGLEPQSINIDALALIGAFKAVSPHTKGVVALLDIGYRVSKLMVLEDNIPYFSRDIETGEFEITQAISEEMGIDFALAKEWAYEPADKVKEINEAIKFVLNSLLDELSLSFGYCERNLEKKVDRLYLSGGGSKVKILTDALGKVPNLEINLWDPTQGFKIVPSQSAKELKEFAPLLAVAIGLAIS